MGKNREFESGNLITWVGEGKIPTNITKDKFYKVITLTKMYALGIENDIREITFRLDNYISIEEYMEINHKMKIGTSVKLLSNGKDYIISGFDYNEDIILELIEE